MSDIATNIIGNIFIPIVTHPLDLYVVPAENLRLSLGLSFMTRPEFHGLKFV